MEFSPVILPPDKTPDWADEYKSCEVCTEKSPVIWGEGNPRGRIAVILDNPGARLDKEGREYVCGTRETLQTALRNAGIPIGDVYVTYLLKCRPLRKYDKDAARAFSKPFLIRQMDFLHPDFLVLLGDTVVQWLAGDRGAHVRDLRGKWSEALGRAAVISYHPLAVRRRPNLKMQFQQDFDMLARRYFESEAPV